MSEYQIDPYKLNDVLQQILDKVEEMQEKSGGASPEFQVLMNNYLTKANEAERNQARFDEALERLDISEQEAKKLKTETEELKERIRSYEKDSDTLKMEHEKEINALRDELSRVIQANKDIEATVATKYTKEINAFKSEAERQITHLQSESNEFTQVRQKLEEKLERKTKEAEIAEKELTELKVKLADEQSKIREEIIEATKRSVQIEQDFQKEKESMLRRIKELENTIEEVNSNLTLKERELQYKDALLNQAIKQPPIKSSEHPSTLNISRTSSLLNQDEDSVLSKNNGHSELSEQLDTEPATLAAAGATSSPTHSSSDTQGVGGIWSKLSSN